jgi:hypothetical protein
MNPGHKLLLSRYPVQEIGQFRLLAVVQGRAKRVLMLPGDLPDSLQHVSPFGRQVQRVRAPVGRAISPFNETAPLEIIEQHHQAAREDADFFAQGLLAQAVGLVDDPQHPRVSRLERPVNPASRATEPFVQLNYRY